MDEDFEPKPRVKAKESKRTTTWSPKLRWLVLDYIYRALAMGSVGDYAGRSHTLSNQGDWLDLNEEPEWVVCETIAADLKIKVSDVGQVLAALVRKGFLSGPMPHPTTFLKKKTNLFGKKRRHDMPSREWKVVHETVLVGTRYVNWDGGRWMSDSGVPRHGKPGYRDTRTTPTKRELKELERKNPVEVPSKWNGLAYRVLSNSPAFIEYRESRRKKEHTRSGGVCTRCGFEQGFRGKNSRYKRGHSKLECDENLARSIHEL